MVHKLVEHNKRLMLWILYEAISEREDANMQFNFDKIIVPEKLCVRLRRQLKSWFKKQ